MDEKGVIPVSQEQKLQAHKNAVEKLKDGRGRPEVITDRVVALLVASFQRGKNVTKACEIAHIGRKAFYVKYNSNQDFRNKIDDARNFWLNLAGDHITNLLMDGSKENLAIKIQTAKWIYEKQMPEEYGQKPVAPGNNTQNNLFILNHGQITDLTKQPDIIQSDPAELFEALEAESQLDTGTEEAGAAQIHSEEIQGEYSDPSDLSQPPGAV